LITRSVSVPTRTQHHIRVEINSRIVSIPVPDDLYAYWYEQFVRQNPTPAQKRRFRTMMNILRAAYSKGREDGMKP
jgi:hypothetical protein